MVDGICRIRAREWERAPIDSEQAVNLWVSAVREFIASLVPDTAVHPVKDFIGEACLIVGARLESGDLFDLDPSQIVEWLEGSGILARYNVRVPNPLPATLEVREWVPADEVIEVTNPTFDGWLGVVRGVEESRATTRRMLAEFLAKRKSEAENDYEGDG